MGRPKKVLATIVVDLLVAGQKTVAGNIYNEQVLEGMAASINKTPVTIEELSPVERKAKNKPLCYSWPEHSMAESVGAEVTDGVLRITFNVRGNKFGKLLMTTMESVGGQDKMTFMPVVIGDTDPDGTIHPGCALQYVTFSSGKA